MYSKISLDFITGLCNLSDLKKLGKINNTNLEFLLLGQT